MSFFDDQEDDWFANNCKGAPSDYYCGELGPWMDGKFTDTSKPPKIKTEAQKARKRRNRARRRAKANAQSEAPCKSS
jgi:hypothetical protein